MANFFFYSTIPLTNQRLLEVNIIDNIIIDHAGRNGQQTVPLVTNLTIGLEVSNYKKMCELLGEEVKNGNAKKAQLKEWERYFSYTKAKSKFLITEIFSEPRPKIDNRVRQSIYIKFIELMLMYELAQKRDGTYSYTKTFLFYLLGMVNQNYLPDNRGEALHKIKHFNINHWQIEHFNSRCNDKLTVILFQALNSMKRRRLLDWEEQRVVTEKVYENDEVFYRSRVATKEEKDFIRVTEKNILDKMGFDYVPFKISDREKYYEQVAEELLKLRGWVKQYKEYELRYYAPHLLNDIPKVKREIDAILASNKLGLNSLVLNALNQQAKKKYTNNRSKVQKAKAKVILEYKESRVGKKPPDESIFERMRAEAKERGEKDPFFEMTDDYIENQLLLANVFINIQEETKETLNEQHADQHT